MAQARIDVRNHRRRFVIAPTLLYTPGSTIERHTPLTAEKILS